MALDLPTLSELLAGKPGKTSIFTKFRQAFLDLEAGSGFSVGGGGEDGVITSLAGWDGTRVIHAESVSITSGHTAGGACMFLRVAGDMTIASGQTLTIPPIAISGDYSGTMPDNTVFFPNDTPREFNNFLTLPVMIGSRGYNAWGGESTGGGGYASGDDSGGAARAAGYGSVIAQDLGLRRMAYHGGPGGRESAGNGGSAGGRLILVIEGNLTLAGTIACNGGNGAGSGTSENGGGGGGRVDIYCLGTLNGSGGTISCRGGDGWQSGVPPRGGGGGGGSIGVYCPNITTSPTYDVAGGLNNTGSADSGLVEENKLQGSNYAWDEVEIRHILRGMGYAA